MLDRTSILPMGTPSIRKMLPGTSGSPMGIPIIRRMTIRTITRAMTCTKEKGRERHPIEFSPIAHQALSLLAKILPEPPEAKNRRPKRDQSSGMILLLITSQIEIWPSFIIRVCQEWAVVAQEIETGRLRIRISR
jgi:hypothetical protein